MPETSEINKILIELQEELEKIKTAAELIEVAKNANDKILKDSKSLFEVEFKKITEASKSLLKDSKELIGLTQKSTDITIKESNELNKSSQNLIKASNNLLNEIKKINFPAKFEKMDLTLSGISTSIQNIFSRFDTIERNIKDDFMNKISNIEKKLLSSQRINRFLLVILILLIIGGGLLHFVPKLGIF
ncbi:MAG: hypothetical protein KAW92_13740 [Candidatus Cloacimonetes bacterium]|nr:hypothetical protein [Candidatus Cloacimonadota bacterium]MCK4359773.1 hypothetical protein [Candidatus Cloacimonadota bacterium]